MSVYPNGGDDQSIKVKTPTARCLTRQCANHAGGAPCNKLCSIPTCGPMLHASSCLFTPVHKSTIISFLLFSHRKVWFIPTPAGSYSNPPSLLLACFTSTLSPAQTSASPPPDQPVSSAVKDGSSPPPNPKGPGSNPEPLGWKSNF